MKFLLNTMAATIIVVSALLPIRTLAGGQFATVETIQSQGKNFVFSSLAASKSQSVTNGKVSFNGYTHGNNLDEAIPLTVTLDIRGDRKPPNITELAGWDENITVDSAFTYTPLIDGVEVSKTILLLRNISDNQISSMVITDDPIPVAAWLAIASFTSFTAIAAYAIHKCDEVEVTSIFNLLKETFTNTLSCKKG